MPDETLDITTESEIQLVSENATEVTIDNAVIDTTPVNTDQVIGNRTGWIRWTWTTIKTFLKTYFDTIYQAILVSGTNIKTINSESILGSGNITITVPDPTITTDTDTTINAGLIKSTGSKLAAAVGATDYMPAYSIDDFVEWVGSTSYPIGSKVFRYGGITTSYYVCKTANDDAIFNGEKWLTITLFQDISSDLGIPIIREVEGITYVERAAFPDFQDAIDLSEYEAADSWTAGTEYEAGVKSKDFYDGFIFYLRCKTTHISTGDHWAANDGANWYLVWYTIGDISALTDTAGLLAPAYERQIVLIDSATLLATGDSQGSYMIPTSLNGWYLIGVSAGVDTASSSGLPTFQIRKNATDLLSTLLTIDATELTSYTATTAAVIIEANSQVATGDVIYVDCDVAGTGTKGGRVNLTFATTLPS